MWELEEGYQREADRIGLTLSPEHIIKLVNVGVSVIEFGQRIDAIQMVEAEVAYNVESYERAFRNAIFTTMYEPDEP